MGKEGVVNIFGVLDGGLSWGGLGVSETLGDDGQIAFHFKRGSNPVSLSTFLLKSVKPNKYKSIKMLTYFEET